MAILCFKREISNLLGQKGVEELWFECSWSHTVPVPWSWVRLQLALTVLLFSPILSEEGRKSLLFPPCHSVSRLGIQDAPRFAGGR